MDASPEYIKQCEKAEEIQELWKPKDGDFYTSSDHSLIEISHRCPCADEDDMGTTEAAVGCGDIWLPRQDQLQEMYARYVADELDLKDISHSTTMMVFIDFCEWINSRYEEAPYVCNPTNVFHSGEQLWLAFLYAGKYNRIWNGEDWVEKEKH